MLAHSSPQLVGGYGNVFAQLVEKLEAIGDALPRFGVYRELFRNHRPLQQALLSVYDVLQQFLTRAKNLFEKKNFRRRFSLSVRKSFEQIFAESLSNLNRYNDLVEREAQVAHMLAENDAHKTQMLALSDLKECVTTNISPRRSK